MTAKKMKLSFSSPPAEDHEKTFARSVNSSISEGADSLEERKADFKNDEELMRETTKFVSEVIEAAKLEAIRRAEQNAKANGEKTKFKGGQTLAGWNNRARGIANRVWNAVCPCLTNNDLIAWAQPFRYRFSRP